MCRPKVVVVRSRAGGLPCYKITCAEHGTVGNKKVHWLLESAMNFARQHVWEESTREAGEQLFKSASRIMDDLVFGEPPKFSVFIDPSLVLEEIQVGRFQPSSFGFEPPANFKKAPISDDTAHAILHNSMPKLPHIITDGVCPTCGYSWFGNPSWNRRIR